MAISGTGLSDTNTRLRFFGFIFVGILAFGAVLYWKHHLFMSQEYVEFPQHKTEKQKDRSLLKSKNFQIETEEVSPSIN